MAAGAGIVVIFDFDMTIIDNDSDNWVIDELGATEIFDRLLHTMPWNSLMDMMMKEIHSMGNSMEDMAECLRRVPLDPHTASAIKSAYALGCDLKVVSDANSFFIETILKHHHLLECFSEIYTNPSYVDEDGRLNILPYQDFTTSDHGCCRCPSNMCKGTIIEHIRESTAVAEGKKKFIYVGDGKGDYCPSLKLGDGDFVVPRKNYPLWNLIKSSPELLKAEVYEWSDGEEQEKILMQLIEKCIIADCGRNAELVPVDHCKLEAVPPMVDSLEALPKALPVRQ